MTNNEYNTAEPKNGGLFDERDFDEMQQTENYRIGFRLFKACYWFMYFFSMSAFVFAVNTGDTAFTVYSAALMAAATVFHIAYSAKVSAKGVMNPKYAAAMGKPSAPVIYAIVLIIAAFSVAYTAKPAVLPLLEMPGAMVLCDCFFARRNNKILENLTKEDESDER